MTLYMRSYQVKMSWYRDNYATICIFFHEATSTQANASRQLHSHTQARRHTRAHVYPYTRAHVHTVQTNKAPYVQISVSFMANMRRQTTDGSICIWPSIHVHILSVLYSCKLLKKWSVIEIIICFK